MLEGSSHVMADTAFEDIEITGLTADSRRVAPGHLFAALPGQQADGRDFIPQAVERGAAAILAPEGSRLPAQAQVPLIVDPNPRRALARMAARFYVRQPRFVAAVTGTNGKTSVASFTRQLWGALGERAASLGTLGLEPPRVDAPAALTTPDPVELQRCLAALAADGFDHLCMEASSHGLHQYRLDGVRITAAAFTNLSRDHLDYHGDMDAYLAAKMRLFTELLDPAGTAVLNADLPIFEQQRKACAGRGLRVLSYGVAESDLRLLVQEPTVDGQRLVIDVMGRSRRVEVPIVGTFQGQNLLAALGLVVASGADPLAAVEAMGRLRGVPGRLEPVGRTPSGGAVFVDYAHTPDALKTVLEAVRPHAAGRLVVVFGCGGDRDRGKRPLMGAIAARLAERAIVTDDNPRSEDPAAIRAEVLAGAPHLEEIGDRARAIAEATADLGAGEVLVIAGKGHEIGQIVGDKVLPFDDREVARGVLADLAARAGEAS